MEETGEPDENHRLSISHWQLSHMHGWDMNPDSGERHVAVRGNALDHTAIRAGPMCVYVGNR